MHIYLYNLPHPKEEKKIGMSHLKRLNPMG
jgi:hypothetical protein